VIDLVGAGAAARKVLRERIRAAQAEDPLAPVTVIVPSNYAGLSARRALAGQGPLVNVRFQVAGRLAELLAAPLLTANGKRPLTPWVRLAAVRAALSEGAGVFEPVRHHPATPRELQRLFQELRDVPAAELERVAGQSARARDVVRLYRRYLDLTQMWFDETELLRAAARPEALASAAAREAGTIILYLPRAIPPSLEHLLGVLVRSGRTVHAIIAATGDEEVDADAERVIGKLSGLGEVRRHPLSLATGNLVVSATDPEEEVREGMRQAMAMVANGTPLHRIAFAYPAADIYAGLCHDALTSAGIPHNAPPRRKLSETPAGRMVLGLPRLTGSFSGDPGFARDEVMDWLTCAPIWFDGREVPSHRWDELSRQAGVVRGPRQWAGRLEAWAANRESDTGHFSGEPEHRLREAKWARELKGFIQHLVTLLGRGEVATASEHAEDARKWLDDLLPERALDSAANPLEAEVEMDARAAIVEQLKAIAALGSTLDPALNPAISRSEFSAMLAEALEAPAGRTGSLGDGIFCGPINLVAEMEFEVVIVLGMVEGMLPRPQRDDPLLTPAERAAAGGVLAEGQEPAIRGRRAYLGALQAGAHRILSTPRGDLRRERATQPSRWLLETAQVLRGKPTFASDMEDIVRDGPAGFRVVRSFESALREPGERGSSQEWNLSSLIRAKGRVSRHFLALERPALARGMEARRERSRQRKGELNAWGGRITPGLAAVPGPERPISPTALETFAKCPFQYFLKQVLHVGEIEYPEDIVTIEPAQVGSIVHDILQRFFDEVVAKRTDPDADWGGGERDTLKAIAGEVFAEFERRGVLGKELTWRAEQARILRDLELLLIEDLKYRRQEGMRFHRAEAGFGMKDADSMAPALLELADGTKVAFRGKVDRVDIGADGRLAVIDYKTGSTRAYESLKAENQLAGARHLQLPVYALAFRESPETKVEARYWFISEQAGFETRSLDLDATVYLAFQEAVETLLKTMRAGYFPAVPGEEDWRSGAGSSNENCRYCPYDMVCPSTLRGESWDLVKGDPGLIEFVELTDPQPVKKGRGK